MLEGQKSLVHNYLYEGMWIIIFFECIYNPSEVVFLEFFVWKQNYSVNQVVYNTFFISERVMRIEINSLTPKITEFLTHFCPLLPMRKREYIMTKPCIINIFGFPFSIYKVKIILPCTGKPIWRFLFKKLPKIWNFF